MNPFQYERARDAAGAVHAVSPRSKFLAGGTNLIDLMKNGVEPKAVLACVETWCKTRLAGPSAQELAEREGTIAPPN